MTPADLLVEAWKNRLRARKLEEERFSAAKEPSGDPSPLYPHPNVVTQLREATPNLSKQDITDKREYMQKFSHN